MNRALEDIAAERQRQISGEGWTPEHDDQHRDGELAGAAACYALSSATYGFTFSLTNLIKEIWPFTTMWWKPTTTRCDLVKAGALIVAEIERLDRAKAKS